jgi:flagellar basal body P-ring formation protein FlgA
MLMFFLSSLKLLLAAFGRLPVVMAGILIALTGAIAVAAEPVDEQVAVAARRFIDEQVTNAGLLDPLITVSVVAGKRAPMSCGEPFIVEPVDARYLGRMRFAAVCNATKARQEFVVRADVSAEVLVTTAAVPAGRMFAATDLAFERRTVSAIDDVFSEAEAVIGQSSRRTLRAGQIVQRQVLVAPVLVRRGDTVRIVARSGPVEVTSMGEALEAGRSDDRVRVRNAATGKVIHARVTGSGMVEPVGVPLSMPSQSSD